MDNVTVEGVLVTPLKIISNPKGDIFHGMKRSDAGFRDFGEAYFSTIIAGEIKGWKKHREMVLNIVVPQGSIRFVVFDDRDNSRTKGNFFSITLSTENYCRLTVPPGVWMAFCGIGKQTNLLLNMASIEHDPGEAENRDLDSIDYDWGS